MSYTLRASRAFWLGIGVLVGLALGGFLPNAPLHASATDRQDTFAIATGMLDDGIDAIYMLDFLSGDLRAAVLNPNTRKFSAVFQRNIKEDLQVASGKSPRYMMVTGAADLRGGGQLTFGASVLYVAELGSNNMGVYAIPYTGGMMNNPVNGVQPLMALQVLPFRTTAVRTAQ